MFPLTTGGIVCNSTVRDFAAYSECVIISISSSHDLLLPREVQISV